MDNQGEDNNQGRNNGKRIGDIVRSALRSGDLSRLGELGPAVEDTVKDAMKAVPKVKVEVRTGDKPAPQQPPQPPPGPQQRYRATPGYGETPPWRGSAVPAKPGRPGTAVGLLRIILGTMGTVVFGLGALACLAVGMIGGTSLLLGLGLGLGAVAAVCLGVMSGGLGARRWTNLAASYEALFAAKTVYTFEELAAKTGKEPKQIKKDMRRLQTKGMLKQVRMDGKETCLMYGDEAWQLYLDSEQAKQLRQQQEAERQSRLADPETAALERFATESTAMLRQIQTANKSLPGKEISQQLDKLEEIAGRIAAYVQQHPEKLPDTRQFMDYYLPTTLKLVEKYQQYEELEYQPENVKQAKAEIERMLDTIHVAFCNLLEGLYQHDTLDVSTDIEVLERKLEQEGLTGKRFEID